MSFQKISENAIETIRELQGRGIKFGVASGREYQDLLLNAGESYAMENALPQVKEIAKHIAPNHNENGVITVLRKYFELD